MSTAQKEKQQRELFARVIQQERKTAIVIALLALVAVFIDMAWQAAVPFTGPGDLFLQIAMGMGFLAVLIWHLVNPVSHIQKTLLAIIAITCIGQLSRLYLALFGYAWHSPPDLSLPTAIGYLPMLTLAIFAVLPGRDAMRYGALFLAAMMIPTGVYVLTHLDYMASSPRMIDLFHLAMLQGPITLVLASLMGRVHGLVSLHGARSRNWSGRGIDESDQATMALNRHGIARALHEALDAAKLNQQELTLGYLEFRHIQNADELDELARRATELFLQELPSDQVVVGRQAADRIAIVAPCLTVSQLSRHCLNVLEILNHDTLQPETRLANMALAAFHPGETLTRLTKRADDQLQQARGNTGLGLAFSVDDTY